MDAAHFRKRAARAREMAESGDDLRISQMLLEVARDLDAEAEAIEAARPDERRRLPRLRAGGVYGAILHLGSDDPTGEPVRIIDLSAGGARLRTDRMQSTGASVVLAIPSLGLRLNGSIVRVRGFEAAVKFDSASSADPALGRLLQCLAIASLAPV